MRQEPIIIDTLGRWADGYRVFVTCHCRHEVGLDLPALAERYGTDTPIDAFTARLRCSRCGSRNLGYSILARSAYSPEEFGR